MSKAHDPLTDKMHSTTKPPVLDGDPGKSDVLLLSLHPQTPTF